MTVLCTEPAGQTIEFEDGPDGDRTATVKCPDDTDDTRYSIYGEQILLVHLQDFQNQK